MPAAWIGPANAGVAIGVPVSTVLAAEKIGRSVNRVSRPRRASRKAGRRLPLSRDLFPRERDLGAIVGTHHPILCATSGRRGVIGCSVIVAVIRGSRQFCGEAVGSRSMFLSRVLAPLVVVLVSLLKRLRKTFAEDLYGRLRTFSRLNGFCQGSSLFKRFSV